ncbi:hypothetical protein B0H14DRAFT_3864859 [Mycena olivaceomarginata]|nr:hypothetical protein B0H14DRAFT_3864859 [Mycena olivaceomarginata]
MFGIGPDLIYKAASLYHHPHSFRPPISPPSYRFMSYEGGPINLSRHDVQALKEILEQYKDGNCERNAVIAALLIGIASICVVEKRAPHIDLVLPYLDQLDACDRDEASDDGSYKTAE